MGPRARVEAPLMVPPRVGLLPSLQAITGENEFGGDEDRWAAGFAFAPESCGTLGVGNPCSGDAKPIEDNLAVVNAEPFYVWAGDKCAPWELSRDWQGRARRQLRGGLSYAIAQELWSGALARTEVDPQGDPWENKYLSMAEADVLTDEATSPTDALARLEFALGRCDHGVRGMIHATRHLATYWAGLGLLRREGNLLLTFLDTIVIADAGYDGSGPPDGANPDGQPAADGSQWAYATGMLSLRLGAEQLLPDSMAEATDRQVNLTEYRIEQLAAVTWDGCCHLAAEVDQGMALIGGAS